MIVITAAAQPQDDQLRDGHEDAERDGHPGLRGRSPERDEDRRERRLLGGRRGRAGGVVRGH
jgi:hypothetical protein